MSLNVHIIMELNEDSIRLAKDLQAQEEVVYILDFSERGVRKRNDVIIVDQAFIASIDHTIFKVFIYEPPYKKAQILQGKRSFIMERKEDSD